MSEVAQVAEQYDDLEQQKETSKFGMWMFLATEILFFSPMFLAYIVYRITYAHAFQEASKELDLFYGTLNTGLLITSSFTMTLAVRAGRQGKRGWLTFWLFLSAAIGMGFLAVKGMEYREDIFKHDIPGRTMNVKGENLKPMHLFFFIYFCLTGLHALHLLIAVCAALVIGTRAWMGRYSRRYHNEVEVMGLYWHFVDSVWVILYPMLYLMGRGSGS